MSFSAETWSRVEKQTFDTIYPIQIRCVHNPARRMFTKTPNRG